MLVKSIFLVIMLIIVHNTFSKSFDTTGMPLNYNATNTTDSPTNGTSSTDFYLFGTIYLEQSSDKNFGQSNRTLELNLVKFWKSVNNSRVKNVLSTSYRAFFNNPTI